MWQSRVGWAIAVSFLCVLTYIFDLAPIFFSLGLGHLVAFAQVLSLRISGRTVKGKRKGEGAVSCFCFPWHPLSHIGYQDHHHQLAFSCLGCKPSSLISGLEQAPPPQCPHQRCSLRFQHHLGVFIEFSHHHPVKLSAAPVLHTCTLGVGHGLARMSMFHLQPWFDLSWILALVGQHPQLPLLLPTAWFSERGTRGLWKSLTLLVHQSVSLAVAPCAH